MIKKVANLWAREYAEDQIWNLETLILLSLETAATIAVLNFKKRHYFCTEPRIYVYTGLGVEYFPARPTSQI